MIRSLLVNTGSNVLVMIVKLIITFVMTPVFVYNLGKYDYGLWEMIGAIIGYAGMLNLGIQPAISRYAAKYKAEGDQSQLLIVFSSALFFMILTGMLLCLFCILWAAWFPNVLAPEGSPSERYAILLIIIGAQLLFAFPGQVAESYLEGFQKYYLKNNITIVNSVIGSTILYIFITPENGLLLLAGINAIGLSVKYVLFFLILFKPAYGAIRANLGNFSFPKLKELISFGVKSLIQGVATRIENMTDSLVIGFVLGPAAVPFYSIPANLVQHLRNLGWTLSHAFMPLFSGMSAMNDQEGIQRVYLMASKYVVGVILPMAAGMLILGAPFLGIWIGPEFEAQGQWIIAFLVIFTLLPLIDPFNSRYLTAINKHGIFARLTPIAAGINLGLSLVLVHQFGILGVAFASTVPAFIFVPIYLKYTCNELGIAVSRYLKESVLPCVVPALLLALSAWCFRQWVGLEGYLDVFMAVLVSGMIWAVAFWLMALNPMEKQYIRARLPILKGTQ